MEYQKVIKDSGLSVYEIDDLIEKWIFSERDRYILKRIILDGICYEKVSEEIGMSVRQTKRIAISRMKILIKHIEKEPK